MLKRLLTLSFVSVLGAFAVGFIYMKGLDFGRHVGKCEAACYVSGGEFIALDGEDHCQCESKGKIKWIYFVEVPEGLMPEDARR